MRSSTRTSELCPIVCRLRRFLTLRCILYSPAKGATDFGNFFGLTPEELINGGIYNDIAIALHTPPHRAVSLALLAQAVGAVKLRKRRDSKAGLPKGANAAHMAKLRAAVRVGFGSAAADGNAPGAAELESNAESVELSETPQPPNPSFKVLCAAEPSASPQQSQRNWTLKMEAQMDEGVYDV